MLLQVLSAWGLLIMANEMPGGALRTGVQHHFVHGLRFDTMWSYQVQSREGRKDWIRLNLETDTYPGERTFDSGGAMWCVRCCASVLAQRPVPLKRLHKMLYGRCDGAHVAAALAALLPGFDVHMENGLNRALFQDTSQLVQAGGSMLLRLERAGAKHQQPPSWMWVVGVELRNSERGVSGMFGIDQPTQTSALLLIGRDLLPSWASGYGAKAICDEDGTWSVRGVDAQTWQGVVSCAVRICPR